MLQQMRMTRLWRPATTVAPLGDRQAWLWSGVILAYLALAYWLINYELPGRFSANTEIYLVRPAIWGTLGVLSYLLWLRVAERTSAGRTFILLAIVASAFSVSALLCVGLLFGFGHSPYARDGFHMGQNLWYLGTFIFGLEMSRSYLMTVWGRANAPIAFTLVALIYAAVWLAPGQFENLTTGDQASLHTAGRTFIPGVSESAMATFLASLGGPWPAVIYHLSLETFRWLSPILPNLSWKVAAFVGTLTPALAMLIVRDAYSGSTADEETAAESESEAQKESKGISPIILFGGGLTVAIIWLYTGMLGVTPYLVSGPSMQPGLGPGDMVFSESVEPASVEVGDIIRFSTPSGDVIHRVIRIENSTRGLTFITKGDNNNVEDPPVLASQIHGRVVFDVPFIGWIPIKIKDFVS